MKSDEAHLQFKKKLAARLREKDAEIQKWFAERRGEVAMPFYSSVDLRDSGKKIAPVDANLYPAGFNNICPEDLRTAPRVFREQIARLFPGATKILVVPEFHTANLYYLENVYYLTQILRDSGADVRIGWNPEAPLPEPLHLRTATEKDVLVENFVVEDGTARIRNKEGDDFVPDFVLLNNDFSGGYPAALDAITKQPIVPSHRLGWHTRKKSDHFRHYNRLATELANILEVDPWTFTIESIDVTPVNFDDGTGVDQVIAATESILARAKQKYAENGMAGEPFVFIKNNSGTYGMGIMVVHSADEVRAMNRRTKNKMSVGKNKSQITSVVVQEGVATSTIVDRLAAEPVIYLMGCELIGGFLRTNTERGTEENLNSQGMIFRKLCMSDLRDSQEDPEDTAPEEDPVLERVYGTVARISALASGYEMNDILNEKAGPKR